MKRAVVSGQSEGAAEALCVGNCGSVYAGRWHYEAAAEALTKAAPRWLEGLTAARVPLAHGESRDVKAVIDFTEDGAELVPLQVSTDG